MRDERLWLYYEPARGYVQGFEYYEDHIGRNEYAKPVTCVYRSGRFAIFHTPGKHYHGGLGQRFLWANGRYYAVKETDTRACGFTRYDVLYFEHSVRGSRHRNIKACMEHIQRSLDEGLPGLARKYQ